MTGICSRLGAHSSSELNNNLVTSKPATTAPLTATRALAGAIFTPQSLPITHIHKPSFSLPALVLPVELILLLSLSPTLAGNLEASGERSLEARCRVVPLVSWQGP